MTRERHLLGEVVLGRGGDPDRLQDLEAALQDFSAGFPHAGREIRPICY
jgi:hypothetical protein